MKFVIFALIPLILSIGIIPIIPFSDSVEYSQICIDKVWVEKTIGKRAGQIVCVFPSTAEKLVERGWGTLLSDDGIDDEAITPDQIKCQIDSFTSQNLGEKMVPVNVMHGNMELEYTEVVFDGVTAMVNYNSGENEWPDSGQSFLIMLMNDENGSSVNSSMYDIQLKSQSGPINVLHLDTLEKQVRLQCWIP